MISLALSPVRHRRLPAVALAALLPASASVALPAAADAARPTAIYGVCKGRHLCTVDPRTKKVTVVRKGTASAPFAGVATTADGRAIAYAKGRRIYRADGRGRGGRQVGGGSSPLISPDGRTVGWKTEIQTQQCDPFGGCAQIQTFALFTRGVRDAKPTVVEAYYASGGWWGSQLATTSDRKQGDGRDLFLLDGDGRAVRPLTQDPTRTFDGLAASPDRRLIAVVSEPVTEKPRFSGRIELFDPATAQRVRILTESATDTLGGFSPDGRQLAFNRGRDLYVVATTGGPARRIAKQFLVGAPSWARTR
ncbi:hypothetical protein PAI11_15350 [Patulibacter medicamentivorans]|uniref:WD40 repeat protein n=1 Tax=Patulibacter medicamentivorans TaxID=1097667 RepID=H0E409_9ACTN|nr:PD40 domain-containing protein [Patulibacter medicamentivorans]EHN11574.1 hypothetical protein PAI11_15350 [Patulibacter medicamentivorans]